MKIIINETVGSVSEVENVSTILEISPFDVAADAVMKSTFQVKGDLIGGTGAGTYARVPAASGDGKVLKSDSGETSGMIWGTAGGDVSVSLTNQCGADVAAGDVVVFESGYDESFNTTTIPNDLRVLGVAAEAILAGAVGNIQTLAGTVITLNCDTGAVNRGEWLVTSAVDKKAKSAGYFQVPGAFALAMTGKSAGSTGTIRAILVQGFTLGVKGISSWAMGGKTNNTAAQKFIMASATYSSISGATLPVAKGYAGGFGNANICGYLTGGDATTSAYKFSYATETWSAVSGMNLSQLDFRFDSGLTSLTKGYRLGGRFGSSASALADKFTFATETRAALSVLSPAQQERGQCGDGVYCYLDFSSTYGCRLTISTDTHAAHSGVQGAVITCANGLSFPATAGYFSDSDLSAKKINFASGVMSNLGSGPSSSHGAGIGVTDGANYGWQSGSGAGGTASDKFTKSTETFSSDAGAALVLGNYGSTFFNNGAY
jgi:hypothetical protein